MATVRDMVKRSMRLLGAIATGETPSADEQADAISALNSMLDSWSIEGLSVFAKSRETFSLTSGQSSFTMGAGGNFDTARPIRIERVGVTPVGQTYELPIEVINRDEWADITIKSTTSTFPTKVYTEGTYPLETVNLWPVPSANATLIIYSEKPLSTFASSNVDVELPPGYQRALEYNLAVEIASEYGKAASNEIATVAMEAKENIKRLNVKPDYLGCDPGILSSNGSFSIITGD